MPPTQMMGGGGGVLQWFFVTCMHTFCDAIRLVPSQTCTQAVIYFLCSNMVNSTKKFQSYLVIHVGCCP